MDTGIVLQTNDWGLGLKYGSQPQLRSLTKTLVLQHAKGASDLEKIANGRAYIRQELLNYLGADVFQARVKGADFDLATGMAAVALTAS